MATSRNDEFRIYNASTLGAALRHYRREAGLSQAVLAERAGITRQYLLELERGKETEQVRRLLRILRQLGVRMTLHTVDW